MADLKLSGTATMAAKHKQKPELKVQRDCHSTDKIYCCNSPWLWRPKEKSTNYTDTFCLFIYEEGGGANHVQRGGEGANKVSLHVSVSHFIKNDSVIAGSCFRFPLCIDILQYLKKGCMLGPEIATKRGMEAGIHYPGKNAFLFCTTIPTKQ